MIDYEQRNDRDGFGEFTSEMNRNYDSGEHGPNGPGGGNGGGGGGGDNYVIPQDIIARDLVPGDDDDSSELNRPRKPNDGSGVSGYDDDDTQISVVIPKPPTNIDWNQITSVYKEGRPWVPHDQYKMLIGKERSTEIHEGETGKAVYNVELILRPLACWQLVATARGDAMDLMPTWSEFIESQLAAQGINACETLTWHYPTLSGYIRIFHVNWRFYMCVILKDLVTVTTAPPLTNKAVCPRGVFLGYHYLEVDKNTAINNKCV
jgi:hypothetical protein